MVGLCEKKIKKSSMHWCYAVDAADAASLCAFVSAITPSYSIINSFFFFFNNVQLPRQYLHHLNGGSIVSSPPFVVQHSAPICSAMNIKNWHSLPVVPPRERRPHYVILQSLQHQLRKHSLSAPLSKTPVSSILSISARGKQPK